MGVLFREYQEKTLKSFVCEDYTLTPPNAILLGPSGTGKTTTLNSVLSSSADIVYATIRPNELVTWKSLIQATSRVIQRILKLNFPQTSCPALDPLQVEDYFGLVKDLNIVMSHYSSVCDTIHIIFDGFDLLQDIDASLLLVFLKLHEQINNGHLKCLFVIRDSAFVHRYSNFGIPTIIFPRYNQSQLFEILCNLKTAELSNYDNREISRDIVENFIQLILQSFHSYTGSNLSAIIDIIDLKWPQYITFLNNDSVNDSATLYRRAKHLFTYVDEPLNNSTSSGSGSGSSSSGDGVEHELSRMARYILIAAYFCSYTNPRYDPSLFSRKSGIKAGRVSYGRRKQLEENPTHRQAATFALQRLLAIFQAIYPLGDDADDNPTATRNGTLEQLFQEPYIRPNIEVFQTIAELYSLKWLATSSMSANVDLLSAKVRWKVNVAWEIILEIARSIDFDIQQYFSDIAT
ncbi:similar to Saccharomyces cerevisiae YNL261W ORC5 Subunit of the origin recognition complex [Maudiozyma saulgeensis]|uniref:Similar to Saccharomyces cerevisiae YNL261W ORC5 Subunit of the origin recognition complex n=1 Tax=Maudiozyma saulgeensis TaxID=1789683 RepID=A0A1X7RBD0_9SACH|nr:similar to Saccharomyces cerevisiae YNL261W ORC5 Subunit of the origin recognition complex [Kazachstania saulgeensis]